MKRFVLDDNFWLGSDEVQAVLKPVMVALKHADEERSLMGFVWPMMLTQDTHFTKLSGADYTGNMPQDERDKALQIFKDRWVYLHSPLHSVAFSLNPRFHGMDHFKDQEVKDDFQAVLEEMLPTLDDVSDALDEYAQYHKKQGPFAKPLLWVRVTKVSPADFWLTEAPKVKWLNMIGLQVLSLTHAAGGAERNWSTHKFIRSDLRRMSSTAQLERYVRTYRNMRLRDSLARRGRKAQAASKKEPKEYPLQSGWSSCDESDDDVGLYPDSL